MELDLDISLPKERPPDPALERAVEELRGFFNRGRERVFFGRQVAVLHEHQYFHWITSRAIRHLLDLGEIRGERRDLRTGGQIHLIWHRGYRYYRVAAKGVVRLVEEYSDPDFTRALGLQGEALVSDGFASLEFVRKGRDTCSFGGKTWTETGHDLDFVFSRDGRAYGVEVKNKLPYIEEEEFRSKMKMCKFLGIQPVFVARMMPQSWIYELQRAGGFALILKFQLYPWTHQDLAKRVREELGLPVDSPRSLLAGTMKRFLRRHQKQL